jgi:phosphatidylethanolamine-binding protein
VEVFGGGGEEDAVVYGLVDTDRYVLGTLTNAYNAEWDCVMMEDCCATTTSGGKEVCMYNNVGVGWSCGLVGSCRL